MRATRASHLVLAPWFLETFPGIRVSQGAVTGVRGAVFYMWYSRQTWLSMASLSSMLRDGDKR